MIYPSLVVLVLLTPLPFASVHPWAWSLFACLVGVLLVAWSAKAAIARTPPAIPALRIWPILTLFGATSLWAALQTSTETPTGWHHPIWAEAAAVLGIRLEASISADRFATGSALLRLLAFGGVFWLALQYGRDARRARRIFYSIALAGAAYAIYGLIVHLTGARMILWYPKTAYFDSLTSTFVNRNSYATYAGLGLVATTGLIIDRIGRVLAEGLPWTETARRIITDLVGREWLLLGAWVAIATALVLTNSRGGFLATAGGLLTLIAAASAGSTLRVKPAIIAAALIVTAGLVFVVINGGRVLDRMENASGDFAMRASIFAKVAELTGEQPWTGSGFGTFAESFRAYRDETERVATARAHNSYLENAAELGIPAAAALTAAVAMGGVLCLLGARRRRRDAIIPAMGLAATVLVGLHSIGDFSLQIPAVAATYALLLGAACAQSWRSSAGRS